MGVIERENLQLGLKKFFFQQGAGEESAARGKSNVKWETS